MKEEARSKGLFELGGYYNKWRVIISSGLHRTKIHKYMTCCHSREKETALGKNRGGLMEE